MATNRVSTATTITSEERTWRINIEIPMDGDTVITFHREEVVTDSNDAVLAKTTKTPVMRSLSAISSQSFTSNGLTVSINDIVGLISAAADDLRLEDLAKPQGGPQGRVDTP